MHDEISLPAARFDVIDGLRIRSIWSTAAEGVPILLTSPWPESIIAFHRIWPALAQAAPLVAIDLPGFGRSEGRPAVLEPHAMGAFVAHVVDAFKLDRPHVVAPDVGTSATLYAAADDSALFRSLVVGGGAIDERLAAGTLKEIIEAPDTTAYEGADGADIVDQSIPRLMQVAPSAAELADYRESYAGKRFVESMAYVRSYPRSLPALRQRLPAIETPVLILYGRNDPIVPPAHAELLHRLLPHSELDGLEAGHIAWEDQAEAYAASVLRWVGGGYLAL